RVSSSKPSLRWKRVDASLYGSLTTAAITGLVEGGVDDEPAGALLDGGGVEGLQLEGGFPRRSTPARDASWSSPRQARLPYPTAPVVRGRALTVARTRAALY
ncbi:hypothetical protein, partial [Streptomyces sp. NPDC004685]